MGALASRVGMLVFEVVLTAAAALSLAFAAAEGFYVDDAVQTAWLPTGMFAVALGALLLAGTRWRLRVPGVVTAVVLAVAVLATTSGAAGPFEDSSSNPALYYSLVMGCTVGAVVLSRTRVGSLALLVLGTASMGVLEFLYPHGHWEALFVFSAAAVALVWVRGFTGGCSPAARMQSAGDDTRMLEGVLVPTGAATVIVLLLATGVFFAVVAPLNPPTYEVKLVTQELSLKTLDVTGVADLNQVDDDEWQTENTDEQQRQDNDALQDLEVDGLEQQELPPELDENSTTAAFSLVDWLRSVPWFGWVLLVLVVLLLLVIPFVVKGLQWRWQARALGRTSCDRGLRQVYHRSVKRLRVLRCTKPVTATPAEYARMVSENAPTFGAGFMQVSEVFVRNVYGCGSVGDAEVARARQFDAAFPQTVRRTLGLRRFLVAMWRL